MSLQCTKSAGHWKVGRGVTGCLGSRGVAGVGDTGQTQVLTFVEFPNLLPRGWSVMSSFHRGCNQGSEKERILPKVINRGLDLKTRVFIFNCSSHSGRQLTGDRTVFGHDFFDFFCVKKEKKKKKPKL